MASLGADSLTHTCTGQCSRVLVGVCRTHRCTGRELLELERAGVVAHRAAHSTSGAAPARAGAALRDRTGRLHPQARAYAGACALSSSYRAVAASLVATTTASATAAAWSWCMCVCAPDRITSRQTEPLPRARLSTLAHLNTRRCRRRWRSRACCLCSELARSDTRRSARALDSVAAASSSGAYRHVCSCVCSCERSVCVCICRSDALLSPTWQRAPCLDWKCSLVGHLLKHERRLARANRPALTLLI